MSSLRKQLVVLWVVCGLGIAGSAFGQCMLANPSFELAGSGSVAFGGWSQFGSVGSTTSAVHGSKAARIMGPNTGNWDVSAVWQPLTCSPGQKWTASVCVAHSSAAPLSGQSLAILNIEWHDSAGNMISYESHTVADPSTPADKYTQYTCTSGAAPAGTASIHFLLGVLQGPTDPTPEVHYDLASCDAQTTPSLDSLQWSDFAGGRTLSFSGRTWRVKGPGYFGPGPNQFDNSASAASVDALGRLHLTIHKSGSTWYSSEVTLNEALGYGDYVFTTRGHLDTLSPNIVLGIFLWEYGACFDNAYLWWNPFNEIDIEYSRWGNAGNADAQFVAQPASTSGNMMRFNASFADSEVTSHAMHWLPDRVEYRSWRGGPNAESAGTLIASWTYTGPHIPRPDSPRVHLNMWQFAGAPATTQEVIFDAFTFRPGCSWGNCGALDVPPPAPGGELRLASPAPNPFGSRTVIRFTTATVGHAELTVFDVAGRRVRRLLNGEVRAGEHGVEWDGHDDAGNRVASGVYLYRLVNAGRTQARRVVVLQ